MTWACLAGGVFFFLAGSAFYALTGFVMLMRSLRSPSRNPSSIPSRRQP